MEETALVKAAQEGNAEAFKMLFDENRKRIYALAYQYTKNVEDTEDLFQETFIKAYNSLDKFRPEEGAGFSSWLYRIGINCCIDFLRKHRKRRALSTDVEDIQNISSPDPAFNPENSHRHAELMAETEKILGNISPRQRMVFILRHYQQLSIREIAECLNCSEGSVKKQLFRAVSTFKHKLKPLFSEKSYEMQKA